MAGICLTHPPHIVPVSARRREIWLPANQAIEGAYMTDHFGHDVLFGSQVGPGNFGAFLPREARNADWADAFLSKLLGIQKQLAPDIIDFTERVIYEIKTPGFVRAGELQLSSYLKIANEITADLDQPPWTNLSATWLPPVTMPLPGNPDKILCTDLTNPDLSPSGVLLYKVWRKPGPGDEDEKQAKAVSMVVDIAPEARDLRGALIAQLRTMNLAPGEFNIIVPDRMAERIIGAIRMQNTINLLSQPSTTFLRNPLRQAELVKWAFLGAVSAVSIVAILAFAAAVLAPAAAGGAAAGGAAAAGSAAAITDAATATAGGATLTLETLGAIKAANDNAVALAATAAAILVFVSVEKTAAAAQPVVGDPQVALVASAAELDPQEPFTDWRPVKFRGNSFRSMARVSVLGPPSN